ncbi:DUF1659 domain-containing protein [Tissierella creatinophila]|uniref:DUF1659 domain-containing protein n=1 Tax=Tissierella creatinophila DSM 6911 TaxID=1123403 RepID=A0A1U7M3R6_TISCR|nr:DUF1659 domain-containing protein [Tissierella creatinophila]OLS01838.1 hypothetical protein TICRE_22150 [Tissierella creatinophila DSM 6911]
MAIKNVKEKTNLKLELDGGIVDEKQKLISKTYSKIKTDALDEELYETALALQTLQSKDLLNVKRVEEMSLISQ